MYRARTGDIEVSVEVEFAPDRSNPDDNTFFWVYAVAIRNLGGETVQLRARNWRIVDASGAVRTVCGIGVVGEQPVIRPGETYRYASGCPLETDNGLMSGSYEMMAADGRRFHAEIPPFSLDTPFAPRTVN